MKVAHRDWVTFLSHFSSVTVHDRRKIGMLVSFAARYWYKKYNLSIVYHTVMMIIVVIRN